MPKQVTLHKVITAVIPDIDEAIEEIDPSELWDLVANVGKVVQQECEFLGSANADMSCPECLASLEVRLDGQIRFINGNLKIDKFNDLKVKCPDNPGHVIPEAYLIKIAKELKNV